MEHPRQIVMDTNVLDSALRSRRGASYALLSRIGRPDLFQLNVSVPVVLEYEDVCKRHISATGLAIGDIESIVDYMCATARQREIFYLWRPLLKDPKDDMVLELAVEAGCDVIVTFNVRDFAGAERFGIRVMTPRAFLLEIGETW
jgi:predicted nucleic acid-binding protein